MDGENNQYGQVVPGHLEPEKLQSELERRGVVRVAETLKQQQVLKIFYKENVVGGLKESAITPKT